MCINLATRRATGGVLKNNTTQLMNKNISVIAEKRICKMSRIQIIALKKIILSRVTTFRSVIRGLIKISCNM